LADLDRSGSVVVAGQFTHLLGNSAGSALAALLIVNGGYNSIIWFTGVLLLLSLVPIYFVSKQLTRKLTLSKHEVNT
jgi:predicted MFS family arabinose efflux permease